MKEFKGKTAFITGGGSGVGLGMAKVFAREGMKVVVADIRRDHLDQALAQLSEHKGRVHAIELDVADRAQFARAADEAERVMGPVSLVCNNAGVNMFAAIDENTYQDWDWIMGVNFGGVLNGVQTFVPRLKARGEGGHIVNTGSMASFITGPAAGAYTASKFAVRGLTEALRWTLGPQGIGVSLLCPGLVASAIHESDKIRPAALSKDVGPVDPAMMGQVAAVHSLGMDPVEVGEAVLSGVKRNAAHIFPHPEFREELTEIFDAILAELPEGEPDPRRMPVEEGRRQGKAEAAKKAADAMR